jgi:hypothetical protein
MSISSHTPPDDRDAEPKFVCFTCVGDTYLSEAIRKDGNREICSYCNTVQASIDIEELADRVEGAFGRHHRRTSTEPDDFEYMLLRDRESNYDWERHGGPVVWAIANAAEIDEPIAADVQHVLRCARRAGSPFGHAAP